MSIHLATLIVQRLGPCQILMDPGCDEALARELGLLGCAIITGTHDGERIGEADARIATVGIVHWRSDVSASRQLRAYRNANRLIVLPSQQARSQVEQQLFAAGWERHPGDMSEYDYAGRENAGLGLSLFRRARVRRNSPLRASDTEADACIARYAMAARRARPGDNVFVDGPAAEVGCEILAALSRASNIMGEGGPEAALPESIDLLVAFHPLAVDWRDRLAAYARVLKPDGRLIVGWRPGDGDAAPADWPSFEHALCERFLLETRYHHTVPAAGAGPRALHPVSVDAPDSGDWLIAVASANPLDGATMCSAYRHPAFDFDDASPPAMLVDFGTAYDNPYLYRVMVQMGERLGDEVKLARLAEIVHEQSAAASADRGAAITVLGYRILEHRLVASVAPLLASIEEYRAATESDAGPHVTRWRLSLAFLAARLCELTHDHRQAIRWFNIAAHGEWSRFSPVLATKAVAASFHEGRLYLARGDMATARQCFRRGLETSLESIACSHGELIGSHERPISFYMQELAEVVDMGSQCANALTNVDLWQREPGLFWRQVDMRRFGLASWARDLERENERLHASR